MSDPLQLQHSNFLADFLLPLLDGGAVRLTEPVQSEQWDFFVRAQVLDSEVEARIVRALHLHAGALTLQHASLWPSEEVLSLSVAIYNFALATDPRWGVREVSRSRESVLAWGFEFLARTKPPTTRSGALVRHILVSRALELRRRDTYATSWHHRYAYLGRPMPTGFWTRPRGAQVEESRPPIQQLWSDGRVVDALREVSPLTTLLELKRDGDQRLSEQELRLLEDPVLRGAAAWHLVRRGSLEFATLWRTLTKLESSNSASASLSPLVRFMAEVFQCRAMGANREQLFSPPRGIVEEKALAAAALAATQHAHTALSPSVALRVEKAATAVLSQITPENLASVRERTFVTDLHHQREPHS